MNVVKNKQTRYSFILGACLAMKREQNMTLLALVNKEQRDITHRGCWCGK